MRKKNESLNLSPWRTGCIQFHSPPRWSLALEVSAVFRCEILLLEAHSIMHFFPLSRFLAVSVLLLLLFPALTPAQHYKQTNLASDIAGMASITDPNLKNPWGITRGSPTPANPNGSPWWVGNNNSGTSTIYNGSGNPANFLDRKSTRLNSSHTVISY